MIIFVLAGGLTAGACDTAGRHLYIAHNTVVGLDAAVNTDPPRGHLVFGYDRQFGAWIPRSVPDGETGNGAVTSSAHSTTRDAMTAIACSKVGVDGIYLTQFTEYLATGRAAELYAMALKAHPGSPLYDCLNQPAAPPQ